ncbi:MAG TPA: ATP-binding protein, partial [Pseudomonadales bacterium]|nr:ATP-binding protein [Pseudomonadales bacterium]
LLAVVSPDVPGRLLGDPGRIRQILLNLVGNAIKFTAEGYVFLRVSVCSIDASAVQLHFSVSDTGIGMSADQVGRLFHSYSQADASVARKYGGTGLGLAISKRLVEAMQGEIGVNSEPGRGSQFWFDISLCLSDNATAEALPANGKMMVLAEPENVWPLLREVAETAGFSVVRVSGASGQYSIGVCDYAIIAVRIARGLYWY